MVHFPAKCLQQLYPVHNAVLDHTVLYLFPFIERSRTMGAPPFVTAYLAYARGAAGEQCRREGRARGPQGDVADGRRAALQHGARVSRPRRPRARDRQPQAGARRRLPDARLARARPDLRPVARGAAVPGATQGAQLLQERVAPIPLPPCDSRAGRESGPGKLAGRRTVWVVSQDAGTPLESRGSSHDVQAVDLVSHRRPAERGDSATMVRGAAAEPWHAAGHAVLALAFGLWAQRSRRRPSESEFQSRLAALEALEEAVQALKIESGDLKKALFAAQERLDLAERRLAQQPVGSRVES